MALGSLQNIIECVPVTSGSTVTPCQTVGGVKYKPVMISVYVIDPSNAPFLDMALEPVDPASVATVFTFAFSFVVFFFIVGRAVGSVLSLIRRG